MLHLAVEKQVAASTQNQAFAALIFFYSKLLGVELKIDSVRAKTPQKLPTIRSQEEVVSILSKTPTEPKKTFDLHVLRIGLAAYGGLSVARKGLGL